MYENIKARLSSLAPSAQPRNMGEYGGFDRADEFEPSAHVRLLSFNIQVGISTASYRHYFTRSWQHFLPHNERIANMDRIARLLRQRSEESRVGDAGR